MSNIVNLINTIDELKDFMYELPSREMRDTFKKLINRTIKDLLNDYCEQSEYFEAVHVRDGYTGSESTLGCYLQNSKCIILKPMFLDYINNYKKHYQVDIGDGEYIEKDETILEMSIDLYLHESRHAKQFADNMDLVKGAYKNGSDCSSIEEFFSDYYDHPCEVDARDYAERYTEDAAVFINDNIHERLLPQFHSMIGLNC